MNKDIHTVLIVSPEKWGGNMLSKHHYALALLKAGYEVFFLNPTVRNSIYSFQKHDSGISIVESLAFKGKSFFPNFIKNLLEWIEIKFLLLKLGRPIDMVWSFDPFRFQQLGYFRAKISIYHAMDNHFTTQENIIQSNSDIVFSNAHSVLTKFSNPNKFFIGHGVANHFLQLDYNKVNLPGSNTFSVGYVGNLNNRLIDYVSLELLISNYQSVDFYFIGPLGDSNLATSGEISGLEPILKKYTNVFWLGEMETFALPQYLQAFHVLLSVYKPDKSGFTVNPHKLLEYLSSGKVIVSTLNEMDYVWPEGVIIKLDSSKELINTFELAFSQYERFMQVDLCEQRKGIAKANSYDNKVNEVFEIVHRTYEKKTVGGFNSNAS